MASEVEICNLALSHLGDRATVASIDPPEGSAQAEHCARYYPVARDSLLEMHTWNFATRRTTLAQVTMPFSQWQFAYPMPADCLSVIAILPPGASDDYTAPIPTSYTQGGIPLAAQGVNTPQPYVCEVDGQGNRLIYTNVEGALVRYIALVTNTTNFTPLFVQALSWHLAAMLAGPILKGEAGAAQARTCEQMASYYLGKAINSDSRQREVRPLHTVSWMAAR